MWEADRPRELSFDTETTGLAYYDTAFCVTAAWERPSGEIVGHYFELVKFDSHKAVRRMLTETERLIGHNLKFDIQKAALANLLDTYRLRADLIEDTQLLAHLLNEYQPKGLKDLMVSVLGWEDTLQVEFKYGKRKGEFKTVVREKHEIQQARTKLKLKKEDGYDKIPRGIVVPYAITDAVGTHRLYKALKPRVLRFEDMTSKYAEEMELTLVLLDMENAGLGVIPEYVNDKVREYTKRLLKIDLRIQSIVGKPVGKDAKAGEFNPGSDDQIKEMFTGLGFERDSYAAKVLEKIDHPLAGAILERREVSKLLSTYLRAIQEEQRNDVLHPSFNQNVSTGRMSSGKQKGD